MSSVETNVEEIQVEGGLLVRREYSDGSLSTEFVAVPPDASSVLAARIDQNLDRLRDGIASFDTDTAAARWATVKLALRMVLALARLVRGKQEVDG